MGTEEKKSKQYRHHRVDQHEKEQQHHRHGQQNKDTNRCRSEGEEYASHDTHLHSYSVRAKGSRHVHLMHGRVAQRQRMTWLGHPAGLGATWTCLYPPFSGEQGERWNAAVVRTMPPLPVCEQSEVSVGKTNATNGVHQHRRWDTTGQPGATGTRQGSERGGHEITQIERGRP